MAWAASAGASARLLKDADELSGQEQHLVLVEGCGACSEQELRSKLSVYGPVAWCNTAGPGRFLVRFVSQDSLMSAVQALDGSCWMGNTIKVTTFAGRQLLPAQQDSHLSPCAESIPAMLPDQLDYLDLLISEESMQAQALQHLEMPPEGISIFQQRGLQELEPCNYEWNSLNNSGSLFTTLDDEPLSADDSPMHSFSSSGPSTCQLWTQRSIGATARKDLAKFAALQNMAQQHSNSSTPGPGLAPAGSGLGGLISPWGSVSSAHSSSMEAAAAAAATKLTVDVSMVRRTSSPGGLAPQHPAATLTPHSPGGFPSHVDAVVGAMQQLMANGTAAGPAATGAWPAPAFSMQGLPGDQGLFDTSGLSPVVAEEPTDLVESFRLQALMAAHQQGHLTQEALPALLSLGLLGGLSAVAGAPQQQTGMGLAGGLTGADMISHSLDSVDMHGILGLAGAMPPPPPPAQQQQQHAGLMGVPPPPPPPPGGNRNTAQQQQQQQQQPAADGGSYASCGLQPAGGYASGGMSADGRISGAASPVSSGVPAPPPPRAMTPASAASLGSSGMWNSPCGSPRFSGQAQAQQPAAAPNPGFRGARQANRVLPGMSNLAHCTSGSSSPGPGHTYDASCSNSQQQQQQQQPPQPPYPRIGSPLQRGAAMPPPPPPPPGYAAAAAAAAAACGHSCSPVMPPVPPLAPFHSGPAVPGPGSPASARGPGSVCSPRPTLLDSMGSTGRAGAPLPTWQQEQQGNTGERGSNQAAVAAAAAAAALAAISGCASGMTAATTTPGQGIAARPGAAATTAAISASQAASGSANTEHSMLKADGALFVQELLQLLKEGASAGNMFLANLTDLLECALSEQLVENAAAEDADASNGGRRTSAASNNSNSSSTAAADKGSAVQPAAVDAAAFLGMLQEAAAPLLAAAAMASQGRGSGSGSSATVSQAGRRGPQRASDMSEPGCLSTGGAGKQTDVPGKGLRTVRTERCSSAAGDSANASGNSSSCAITAVDESSLSGTAAQLLLRHQLLSRGGSCSGSSSGSNSPIFYPLHPRTTTHGCRDSGSSSCGGAAPGTPHGTPMLLVPQSIPELLSARAALMRLMMSAHSFVQSPAYYRMAERLEGIAELYDSMHDDPVVMKRRKCRDMATMREAIKHDPNISQAVASLSSLRNHIYSLSRKVLIGYGHVEGLPVDLLLGGLTSELAAILAEPAAPPALMQQQGTATATAAAAAARSSGDGSGPNNSADGGAGAGGPVGGSGCLSQQVLEFYTSVLPLPKLALLVFTEFVPVDPAPSCMAIPPAAVDSTTRGNATGVSATEHNQSGSAGGNGSSSSSSGTTGGSTTGGNSGNGSNSSRLGSMKERRNGSSHDHGDGIGSHRQGRGGGNTRRFSKDGDRPEREQQQAGSNHDNRSDRADRSNGGSRLGSRGGSFNNGNAASEGGNGSSKRTSRRSCEFDLVAEAAALEAAATAAAPLVAAAVCDLPTGRKQRSSNSSDN